MANYGVSVASTLFALLVSAVCDRPLGIQVSQLAAVARWSVKQHNTPSVQVQAIGPRLGLAAPQGSTFLFFDVAPHLDETGLAGFLERCVDRGLFLSPGLSFGPYPTHVRLCFTAAPPDVVERGVEALAPLIGR